MKSETESLLRLPEVLARTGLSRSSLYAAVARGDFEKPVNLTERSVAWPASSVQAWIEARIAARQRAA